MFKLKLKMFENQHRRSDNHEDNRGKICLLCLTVNTRNKSGYFRQIRSKGEVEKKINRLFVYNVSVDEHLPNAICSKCLTKLYRAESLEAPNLSEFRKLACTRSAGHSNHNCTICKIVTQPLFQNVQIIRAIKNPSKENVQQRKKETEPTNFEKILKSIKQLTQKEKDQLISILLKEKAEDKNTDRSSKTFTTSLSQRAGRPLRISIGSKLEKSDQPVLSTNDMKMMKTSYNLSQNTTIGIAAFIRRKTRKRKIIEPNLKKHLADSIHSVDKFFEAKSFDFVNVKSGVSSPITKNVVYCKNLHGFLEYVKNNREVFGTHLKFGIDGGGGFLKFCLSVQSLEEDSPTHSKRRKYTDDTPSKRFRDSGVKKLFILALAETTQENYDNVLQLWTTLEIDKFDGTIAVDLKLANILCGIMSHSSLHPCTWCYAKKDELHGCSELRTIGSILDYYKSWKDAGSVKGKAKDYMNCIMPPILGTDLEKRIIDIVTPPELHLMLGVVNTLYDHMLAEFEDVVLEWTKRCNVTRDITRSGSGFNGNACKTLLKKVDLLRSICPIGCLKYVKTLDNFQSVVKSCFGGSLNPDFSTHILNFKKSYLELEIAVTPKVHSVFYHVNDFCYEHQKPLRYFSEQAMESVHFDFKSVWTKYQVKPNHADYASRLLKAVCEYNGLHL